MPIRGLFIRIRDILKLNVIDITSNKTCDKKSLRDAIKKSLSSWKAFKKDCANNYTYEKKEYYNFGRHYKKIYTTVENGKVVEAYETKHRFIVDSFSKFDVKKIANNTRDDLVEKRSLTTGEISKLKTLDEIYIFAKKLMRVSSRANDIFFEVNKEGLIAEAGFSPRDCVDSCFRGYHINSITPLKASPER
ncbi:hypothetical protein BKI52_37285 [marine bacterium AO1-C]|nr:hypothetical protein BKI52_37285 [marine bacterium AO1-C]